MSQAEDHAGTRRDFLYYATAGAGAVAAGAAVWPLINQMNPSADVLALAKVHVDISNVEEGTQITAPWQGKPIFIRYRTKEDIDYARSIKLADLPDPLAENSNLPHDAPATDENRALSKDGKWLVMIGICTHLGCIPLGNAGNFHGWFCPCHGSQYDSAGRIRQGPAPRNMQIPVCEFVDPKTIQIG